MNILQVSNSDRGGGAESVAWNLFLQYREMGESSWLAVGRKHSEDAHVLQIPNRNSRSLWSRLWMAADDSLRQNESRSRIVWSVRRALATIGDPVRGINYLRGLEDFRFPGTRKLLELIPGRPDIVQAHNLHGAYFDLRELVRISNTVPLMLTMHDAWLTTGHCAHSLGCERWAAGCGECPDLTLYPAVLKDATARNWNTKKQIYERSRLYIATPSQWLMDRVRRSILRAGLVETRVIPNGIDLSVFKPGDRKLQRERLSLPQPARILLFAAVKARTNMWKDFDTLMQAVRQIAETFRNETLLFVAVGESGPDEHIGNATIRYAGPIESAAEMAAYYQASDVYMHAARADTFPSTVLEAQACGIPVVATAVGGIPEQIVHGSTGFLTAPGDAQAMANAVADLLKHQEKCRKTGTDASNRAKEKYDVKAQAAAYLDWQREIVLRKKDKSRAMS